MKRNNSSKPFFKEGRKDSDSSKPSSKPSFKGKNFGSDKPTTGKKSFGKKDDAFSKPSFGKKPDFKNSFGDKKFGNKFKSERENRFDKKSGSTSRGKYSQPSDRQKGEDYNPLKYADKKSTAFTKKQFFTKREEDTTSERPRRDDFGAKKLPSLRTSSSFGKKSSFGSKSDKFSSNDRSEGKRFEKKEESSFAKKQSFSKKTNSNSASDRPKRDEFGSKNFGRRGEGIFELNSSESRGRDSFDFDSEEKGSNTNQKSRGKKESFDFDQPTKKESKSEVIYSNEGGKGMVYKGRGRDQRPVFEPRKENSFQEKPAAKQGFGKNRFRSPEENIERPDYNFEALPAKKAKGKEEDGSFRLNKYIANSGICGRREADLLISKGLITVNGVVTTELGLKVKKTDRVVYQGKKINPEKPVYVLLNKPKDFITTTEDPMERKTVMSLVNNACEERIFPVGRLDRNTTGLLLFTNDGELAAKLSHPSNQVKKIYQVTLDNPITQKDEEAIREGLTLEDGPAIVDDMQVLSKDRTIIGLEIHIGRNRIVRRLFAHLGYEVTALDRVMYAGLDKKDLKRGHYRFLSEQEVIRLKYFV
jgi:23S rRNA pseudouridine2605 synthase